MIVQVIHRRRFGAGSKLVSSTRMRRDWPPTRQKPSRRPKSALGWMSSLATTFVGILITTKSAEGISSSILDKSLGLITRFGPRSRKVIGWVYGCAPSLVGGPVKRGRRSFGQRIGLSLHYYKLRMALYSRGDSTYLSSETGSAQHGCGQGTDSVLVGGAAVAHPEHLASF